MEKAYLGSMFPNVDQDIIDLAIDASGGNSDNALNALLAYQAKKEGAATPTVEASGELVVAVVTNDNNKRASFTFQAEQKVSDVIEAIKQRDGWSSKGILYHNYFEDGTFIAQKLSALPDSTLCMFKVYLESCINVLILIIYAASIAGWRISKTLLWYTGSESAFNFDVKTVRVRYHQVYYDSDYLLSADRFDFDGVGN